MRSDRVLWIFVAVFVVAVVAAVALGYSECSKGKQQCQEFTVAFLVGIAIGLAGSAAGRR